MTTPTFCAGIKPDITVAADGSEDFKTIQAAVESIPTNNHQRVIIYIKDGIYHEKVRIDPASSTLRGQSRTGTRIEFPQGDDEFLRQPDALGRAVVNIIGSDFVLENLTVKNTHGVIGPHAIAIHGRDRTVIVDCDVLSDGADTLALGKDHRTNPTRRGSTSAGRWILCAARLVLHDRLQPLRVNPKADAMIWHDGSKDKDMKFVLRDCKFDGAGNWILARHHHDAQFYLLDCKFSKTMRDWPPHRVIYPLEMDKPSAADAEKNRKLDASNIWGERYYFSNCHRAGGDYAWLANNLSTAPNSPTPKQITAAWTFGGKWNPENKSGPTIQQIKTDAGQIVVTFSEAVTVKGKPQLKLQNKKITDYASGSGTDTLVFTIPNGGSEEATAVKLNGGAIIACEAAATLRPANLSLPH